MQQLTFEQFAIAEAIYPYHPPGEPREVMAITIYSYFHIIRFGGSNAEGLAIRQGGVSLSPPDDGQAPAGG